MAFGFGFALLALDAELVVAALVGVEVGRDSVLVDVPEPFCYGDFKKRLVPVMVTTTSKKSASYMGCRSQNN